jgi:hypothetical protein
MTHQLALFLPMLGAVAIAVFILVLAARVHIGNTSGGATGGVPESTSEALDGMSLTELVAAQSRCYVRRKS